MPEAGNRKSSGITPPRYISKKRVFSGRNSGCVRTQALRHELPARLYRPYMVSASWLRPGASGATPHEWNTPAASGGSTLHLVHQKRPWESAHQGYLLGDKLVLSRYPLPFSTYPCIPRKSSENNLY